LHASHHMVRNTKHTKRRTERRTAPTRRARPCRMVRSCQVGGDSGAEVGGDVGVKFAIKMSKSDRDDMLSELKKIEAIVLSSPPDSVSSPGASSLDGSGVVSSSSNDSTTSSASGTADQTNAVDGRTRKILSGLINLFVSAHNKKLTGEDVSQLEKVTDVANQAVGGDSATNTNSFGLTKAACTDLLRKVEKLIVREEVVAKNMPEVDNAEVEFLQAVADLVETDPYKSVDTAKAKKIRSIVTPSDGDGESCAIM
jgi:hypothetical protein